MLEPLGTMRPRIIINGPTSITGCVMTGKMILFWIATMLIAICAFAEEGSLNLNVVPVPPNIVVKAEVKNVVVKQVENRVEFTYDLIGEEAPGEVAVAITVEGKTYRASSLHLEGDFGKVRTGKGKVIHWDVLQDFPKGFSGTIDWVIVAKGGKEFISGIRIEKFILIPAGIFVMGGHSRSGTPHQVTISKPFYMQSTTVTQGEWKKVMGSNPSYFKNCGDECPVEEVSWNDVQDFIQRLNNQEGKDKYRLPTEAEWEYAARSCGKMEEYAGTNSGSDLGDYAWYDANSGGTTHPVGLKKPNGLGLYDMSGNVWQWVQDWYGDYRSGNVTDPAGPLKGSRRVSRGGSWHGSEQECRSANRGNSTQGSRFYNLGFRLVRTN